MGPPRSPEQVFQELDANKDGVISKEEFLKRHAPSGASGDGQRPEPGRPDARREGFGFGRQGPFGPNLFGPGPGSGPRPGSGSGTGPFGRGLFGPPSVDMIFRHADRNHDGKVTKDEVPDFIWKRLSEADTDKDGAVSKSEMEEHLKKRFPGKKPDSGDNRPTQDKPKSPSA